MPISPTKAFIACNTQKTEEYLFSLSSMHFVKNSNRNILRFAQKYAWNTDDQLINRANEYLSADAPEGEAFFLEAPNRALHEVRASAGLASAQSIKTPPN
jgi:hypothetical protein